MSRSYRLIVSAALLLFLIIGIVTPAEAQSNPNGGGYWLQSGKEKMKQATMLMKEGKSVERYSEETIQEKTLKRVQTLEELRKEDKQSNSAYESKMGPPTFTALGWEPPAFDYDHISTVEECRDNSSSSSKTGYIKNHYSFCWSHVATYQIPRSCRFGFCSYDGVQIQFTEIGYGSNQSRKMRVYYSIDDILVTNPSLNGAKLKIDLVCQAKINAGDCKPDSKTPAIERTIAQWKNTNFGLKTFLSDAPPASEYNPDQIGYMDFWPKLTIKHAPKKFTKTIDGIKQRVRFDSAKYMFAFPDQHFWQGAIFSKTDAVLNVPITKAEFAPLKEAGEHWKFAMDHPEKTKPYKLGKKIPGALGDRPLTRMYTKRHPEEYAKNRAKTRSVCNKEFKDEDRTGKECDEFPFASTWEGSSTNGQDWFSVKLIPKESNNAAGRWLAAWYAYDRILDDDPFYVQVKAPVKVGTISSYGTPKPGQDHRSSDNFSLKNIPAYTSKLKWKVTSGPKTAQFDVMHDDNLGIDETIFNDLKDGSVTDIKTVKDIYIANPEQTNDQEFNVDIYAIP
ncbi:NucA/NucB deoxyribonuclease domain-containing protein [Fictibacillus sp. WQ 8-8]|uniref:NucA/NucB deoxyribonuclease domain-containing protein n=1 Tax=Fictibacillus sp. WQ 8-8 TaxID=2938788 RepID=UPI00210EF3C3|nr:NucA/NucB deoxyribonuclease domain-containing protein [Fictibacillus sp. WQ 8-8]MCQ6265938.1 NucA/NucB deoxyribonuclease domain-containing protein [Fictibacillus sp. WQ 8-8]